MPSLKKQTMRWRELERILWSARVEIRKANGRHVVLKRGMAKVMLSRDPSVDVGPATLARIKRYFEIEAL